MRLKLFILSLAIAFLATFVMAEEKPGKITFNKTTVLGEIFDMDINNIDLPLNNDGSTGEDGRGYYPNGTTLGFLFQGGFATTAYVDNVLHASWMAKASLIQEYQPGTWGMDPDDGRAKFYVVNKSDTPGEDAYKAWADAVNLGADFKDVNGDGVYDPSVDHPDILGDKTAWCVYNDGTDISLRTPRLGTPPIGLEVQQTAFAFARADALGDVIFFRYRFLNVRDDQKDINDLIFTLWADPDLGDHLDDLIGCDTTLSLGYIYNDGSDTEYGAAPPAFGVDFFQGPVVETGVPSDTALLYRGPQFGVDTLFGWVNLPMTSYMYYIQSDPVLGDPDDPQIARNYQEGGLDKLGNPIDRTAWGIGGDTPGTDSSYFYSGDPVTASGWLDNVPADKRFMVNCGPFELAYGDTQDVVVAYIVSQGTSALNSVAKLKETDEIAQQAYNANFFVAGPPPPPQVKVLTFDKEIQFVIDLSADSTYEYDESDELLNRQVFEGVKIYQLASPSTNEFEGGVLNRQLIFSYDINNEYKDIYQSSGFQVDRIYSGKNNIDTSKIVDKGAAVLKFTVNKDAFGQDGPLVNNIEYYFSITAFSLNKGGNPPFLADLGGGSWQGGSGVLLENNLGGRNLYRVIPGSDENTPYLGTEAEYTGPRGDFHSGRVFVDVVDNDAITGDDYSIRFFDNGNFWQVFNETADSVTMDSLVFQDTLNGVESTFPIIDGLSIQVQNTVNGMDTAVAVIDAADTNSVVWLQGAGQYSGETSTFGRGIALIQHTNRANLSPGQLKDKYFPVKLSFETSTVALAQHYSFSYVINQGMKDTYVTAWDIRDEDNPRQLYIAYVHNNPNGTIDFSQSNSDFIILDADYQATARYGPATTDTLFKKEGYMAVRLVLAGPLQANRMDIIIDPWYPNSDVDVFYFSGQKIFPSLSVDQQKDQLANVKVVPNPYWAYSIYESSYDTPVLKFTHLDREVTIRIFDLAGQLVKTLRKNDESNELSWNLRNESDLKVGSGMYFAYVEVPGVGSKILKFAIIQREERIDRF